MYPPGSDDRDQLPSKHRKDIPWAKNIPDKKSILQSHLRSYCQQTSLHGYQYLADPGLCSRIFWSLIILSSTVVAIGLFVSSLTSYLHSRPMTTISDTTAPLSHLYFPSIALCNINQVSNISLEVGVEGLWDSVKQLSFTGLSTVFIPTKSASDWTHLSVM